MDNGVKQHRYRTLQEITAALALALTGEAALAWGMRQNAPGHNEGAHIPVTAGTLIGFIVILAAALYVVRRVYWANSRADKPGMGWYYLHVGILAAGAGAAFLLEKIVPILLFRVHMGAVAAIIAVLFIACAVLYHKTGVL